MPISHVLFESASGYAIFEAKITEDIGSKSKAVGDSFEDLAKFGKMVSLMSFSPFRNAAQALENINDVSEGILNDHLRNLLELNLSKTSKKSLVTLAVADNILGKSIKDALGFQIEVSEAAQNLIRGIRFHASKLLTGLQSDDLTKAQLGLGHSYSRSKVKFNVNRTDNMIIQAIALLDQLDKDVNLFSMRIREWYGFHFPELVRLVPDNHLYARVAKYIGNKESLSEEKLPELTEMLENDSTLAQNILDAARGSMGSALADIDMLNISAFATRVISLADYRKSLLSYLTEKMNAVAPSLTALLGERIGARLISHAGSLTNLSKYPASTVQILGAEKALFRALKTKGNTPKYGLLYHSTFIGRAGPKHKGRISRFLANKCSIASRIDCFSENPTSKFGEALRGQVEERLNFFATGAPPTKNAEALRRVGELLVLEDDDEMEVDELVLTTLEAEPAPERPSKEKKRKRKKNDMDVDEDDDEQMTKSEKRALKKAKKAMAMDVDTQIDEVEPEKKEKPGKKGKKEKKQKAEAAASNAQDDEAEPKEKEKKEKKKKKE